MSMNGSMGRRLLRLEGVAGTGRAWPAYVCLAEGEDVEAATAGLPRWVKVYGPGFCPDDWDRDDWEADSEWSTT